ncbi:MAG: hypothetical protein HKN76_16120 [Saprospiraceae bacterium]|nr:hypothetical protein [Saprospiraceae bacterium]
MIRRILYLISFLGTFPLVAQTSCDLDSVRIEVSECSDGQVDLWLDFTPPTLHSDQFTVKGNGHFYGSFSYSSLPAFLGTIEVKPEKKYEFVIQDNEIDTCFYAFEYGKITCNFEECAISELTAYSIDSCRDGSTYNVWLDFVAEGLEAFDVYINGAFHSFYETHQLPLIVEGVPASGKKTDLLKIFANDRNDCYQIREIVAPNCANPCEFYSLDAKAVECEGDSFFVKLYLEHEMLHGDSFGLAGNGVDYGRFPFHQLPVILGPFVSGEHELLEFELQDIENPDCIIAAVLDGSPCRSFCSLADLTANVVRCDSGTFDVELDFFFEGDLSDSFKIKGNGQHYGYFSYRELPLTLVGLEANSGVHYEFAVYDQSRWECNASIELGPVNCDCVLYNLEAVSGDCTSDSTYVVELNFQTDLTDTFDLYSGEDFVGTFHTSELPLRLENFPGSGHKSDDLSICLRMDTYCCVEMNMEAPDCIRRDCGVLGFTATALDCEDGQYYINVGMEEAGDASGYFHIEANGALLGEFKYAKLPLKVGPFPVTEQDRIVLDFYDDQIENCHQAIEVEAPKCTCSIGDIEVEIGECTSDSTYRITLDVAMEGYFDFYINGHFCGTFNSDELPRVFDDFPASGAEHDVIKICGSNGLECCREKKITAPGCAVRECGFENLRYEISDCDADNQFFVLLDFDTVGAHSETFIVQQGEHYLEYAYAELPVRVGPFTGGSEFYKLKICDGIWHDCHQELILGRVICEAQCDFASVLIELEECVADDNYYILRLDSVDSSFPAFDIYYGEMGLGFYKRKDLPLRLKVPVSEEDSVTLSICVSDNLTCCYSVTIAVPLCGNVPCDISGLHLDTVECRGDSVWMNLDLNTGSLDNSGYVIKINGDDHGKFYFDDIPLHIGPFLAGNDQVFEIEVKSLANPNCALELRIDDVTCPENNLFNGSKLLILESVENRVYVKVPDFISDPTDFNLVDLQGRILHNVKFSTELDRAVLRIPFMTSGMYIVRMRSAEGLEHIAKVIMP